MAATGDMGKLFRLADFPDAGGSVRIARARLRARWRAGAGSPGAAQAGKSVWRRVSGNSARPDKTWSDWSEPLTDPQNSLIRSPNARYIQWRAELNGPRPRPSRTSSIAYLPQNNPPVVRSINVTTQAPAPKLRGSRHAIPPAQRPTASPSPTPAMSPLRPALPRRRFRTAPDRKSRSPGRPTIRMATAWSTRSISAAKTKTSGSCCARTSPRIRCCWMAMFWPTAATISAWSLPTGRPTPPTSAREDELVSSPVLIDNTPPVVTLSAPRRTDDHVEVDADVVDQTSPAAPLRIFAGCRPVDSRWKPPTASPIPRASSFTSPIDKLAARRTSAGGPRLRHAPTTRGWPKS